jgi:hypothetical protein
MSRDPFEFVSDAPLFIVPHTLDTLRAYRDGPRLAGLPGPHPSPARARLAAELDRLCGALHAGVEQHPTRFWVLKQCQRSLLAVQDIDRATREDFGIELGRVLAILGVWDADAVLGFYLGST